MHRIVFLIALLIAASSLRAQPPQPELRALGVCSACVVTSEDFSGQRLTAITLRDASISDVGFEAADLSFAVFDGARLERVTLRGARLVGASFVGAHFIDVDFTGADLRGAVFEGAVLTRTELSVARLCNTQLPDDRLDTTHCN